MECYFKPWMESLFSELFSNLSPIYSDYYYGFGFGFCRFQMEFRIKNYNVKYDFKTIFQISSIELWRNAIYEFNPTDDQQ
jgi:hypothetical protein